MVVDEFVSDEDWQAAPQDDRAAFLFIADRARAKLKTIHANANDDSDESYIDARYSFVHDIFAIASQLGIGGLPSPTSNTINESYFRTFDAHLRTILAGLSVENRGKSLTETVSLSYATKTSIRNHLEELRNKINNSNLSDKQKANLHKRVDAVEAELDKRDISTATVWLLSGALHFAGAVSDLGGFATVVKDINQLLHTEVKTDAERKAAQEPPRLTNQPIKQLEDRTGQIDQDTRQA